MVYQPLKQCIIDIRSRSRIGQGSLHEVDPVTEALIRAAVWGTYDAWVSWSCVFMTCAEPNVALSACPKVPETVSLVFVLKSAGHTEIAFVLEHSVNTSTTKMKLFGLSSLLALLCIVPVAGAYDERVLRFDEEFDVDGLKGESQLTIQEVSGNDGQADQVYCDCIAQTCSCCADVKLSKINIDDMACMTVTDAGGSFALDFTFGNKKAFSTAVSNSPLPSPCIGLGMGAQVCFEFYNVKLSPGKGFGGCVRVIAKMVGKTLSTVDLGCFYV